MMRTHSSIIVALIASILLSCTDFQEAEIPVAFGVSETLLEFTPTPTTHSVTVSSGSKWDVTSKPEWISLQSIDRSESTHYEWTATFSAATNEEYDRDGKIVIKSGSEVAEIKVVQEGKEGKYVAVESVSLSSTKLTLTEGENTTLSYVITPSNASVKGVSWQSSLPSVATVSHNGQIEAIAEGTSLITITTKDGNKTASCEVTVKAKVVPVSGVSLDKTSLSMTVGETWTLKASISPENATDKSVNWSSSNTSVATVSSSGTITAKSTGAATITVKTTDGSKTATCSVTVLPTSGTENGHEWIDIGLSVKWSPYNYGASSTTDNGGYYFWGDPTGTASVYYYSAPQTYHISGTSYDIAKQQWGGSWRLPTFSEVKELYTKCSWSWTTLDGKAMLKATGPNGKSIYFVPTGLMYNDSYQASDCVIILSGDSFNATSFASYVTIYPYFYKISPDGEATEAGHSGSNCRFPIRPVI